MYANRQNRAKSFGPCKKHLAAVCWRLLASTESQKQEKLGMRCQVFVVGLVQMIVFFC